MKKLILALLLAILVSILAAGIAAAMTEEEILKAVEENKDRFEMGGPLTKDDFLVFTNDDRIEKYDNDLIVQMFSRSGGSSWWSFWGCTQKSIELFTGEEHFSMSYTLRGIIIEDTVKHDSLSDKASVLQRYGTGVAGSFDPKTDVLYKYMKRHRSDKKEKAWGKCYEMMGECDTWLLYNYKDAAQIKFYFDVDDNICFAGIFKGIQEHADKETMKRIQEYLNENGYKCGKASGKANMKTKSALKKFQEDHGLFPSGYIDDSLMRYLEKQQ